MVLEVLHCATKRRTDSKSTEADTICSAPAFVLYDFPHTSYCLPFLTRNECALENLCKTCRLFSKSIILTQPALAFARNSNIHVDTK